MAGGQGFGKWCFGLSAAGGSCRNKKILKIILGYNLELKSIHALESYMHTNFLDPMRMLAASQLVKNYFCKIFRLYAQ